MRADLAPSASIHPTPRHPTLALVGNAAPVADHSAAIDANDHVWRFNNCPGMETGLRGQRTSMLWLVNSGGSMRERLEMDGFDEHPAMRGTADLAFPVHPTVLARYHPEPSPEERAAGARNDWTDPARERWGKTHRIVTLPPEQYDEACAAIGLAEAERSQRYPSTGFLAAHSALTRRPEMAVTLYGFTFEGWDGHAWQGEQRWLEAMEAKGRVRIVREP